MADKCIWCNRNNGESLKSVEMELPDRFGFDRVQRELKVHEDCEPDLEKFIGLLNRFSKLFVGFMLASLVLILVFTILTVAVSKSVGLTGIGLVIILIGLVVFGLPFATPETVKMIGMKKSKFLVRLLSFIVLALGIWIVILAF